MKFGLAENVVLVKLDAVATDYCGMQRFHRSRLSQQSALHRRGVKLSHTKTRAIALLYALNGSPKNLNRFHLFCLIHRYNFNLLYIFLIL